MMERTISTMQPPCARIGTVCGFSHTIFPCIMRLPRPMHTNEKNPYRALMFPGQGSQRVGMTADLVRDFHAAQLVVQEAEESALLRLADMMAQGPEETLRRTENTQVALLTHGVAVFAVLRDELGFALPQDAGLLLGHSVGEYAALVASGSVSLWSAVQLVQRRGRFMQEAVPEGQGAMSALVPTTLERARKLCHMASEETGDVCEVANVNTPDQVVVSGTVRAVERCGDLAKRTKAARRVIPLSVSAPFHCALMKPAADRLWKHLKEVRFSAPRAPLVSNVTGECVTDETQFASLLRRQITAPVLWDTCMRTAHQAGVRDWLELGPGSVLSGLVSRMGLGNPVALGTSEDIKQFLRSWKGTERGSSL